jgi:hypothetical protein
LADGVRPVEPTGSIAPRPKSLSTLISGFKSTVTRQINEVRATPDAPVWQRSYHDRVLRNEGEVRAKREYIINNPWKWELDEHYVVDGKIGTIVAVTNAISIKITLDDQKILKYATSGRSLHFGIAWEFDGETYYPDHLWEDFGVVLLGSWLRAAIELANSTASTKLLFMEGEACLFFTHYHDEKKVELRPRRGTAVWTTDLKAFTSAILDASQTVQEVLTRLNVHHRDMDSLNRGIELFKSNS